MCHQNEQNQIKVRNLKGREAFKNSLLMSLMKLCLGFNGELFFFLFPSVTLCESCNVTVTDGVSMSKCMAYNGRIRSDQIRSKREASIHIHKPVIQLSTSFVGGSNQN